MREKGTVLPSLRERSSGGEQSLSVVILQPMGLRRRVRPSIRGRIGGKRGDSFYPKKGIPNRRRTGFKSEILSAGDGP